MPELIEAHYLFDIPFSIWMLIHPQAIVHSIIKNKNLITNFNLFKNDMKIPILNFLLQSKNNHKKSIKNIMILTIIISILKSKKYFPYL